MIMFDDIYIVHHRSQQNFVFTEPAVEQLLWRTCVRSVLFCSAQALEEILLDESDEVYRGVEAYRFLLNIVCGLQSPIKGETEI